MADLWIRSQVIRGRVSSILTEVTTLRMEPFGLDSDEYAIYCDSLKFPLGVYKTEERAGEVLDEIQKLNTQSSAFLKSEFIKDTSIEASRDIIKNLERIGIKYVGDKDCEIIPTNATNIVYQMPKE